MPARYRRIRRFPPVGLVRVLPLLRAASARWRAPRIAGTIEVMDAHLREIVDRGGRAQSAEAARLLIRLESDPEDADARSMARVLVDAYLNDPDLTR
jgi:hypothetical protein